MKIKIMTKETKWCFIHSSHLWVNDCFLFKQQAAGIIQRVWKTFLRRKEIKRNEVLQVIFSIIRLSYLPFIFHFFEIEMEHE